MSTETPQVDKAKINEALYYFAMASRCLVKAAGGLDATSHAPAVVKIKDAARYLACSPRDLMRMRATGDLEPLETEWGPRWTKASLDAFIDQCVADSQAGRREECDTVGVSQ